jgi:tetratricopeptide (TPR) repeat protein
MKNFTILLLTVFILSCATAPPQISDDGFVSSQPNFQVQFHKPIVGKFEKSERYQQIDAKIYLFMVNNTESIMIQIFTYIPSRSGFEFYGPEQVLTNMGYMVLDSVDIDGRQWIKYVDILDNNSLFTGYFRMIGRSFISVGRICETDAYTEEISSFRKGTALSYEQGKLWNEAFAHTDQLFSIGMVTTAESKIEKPLSATEEIKETDAVAYYNRGRVYYIQGYYDKAFSEYTKAIEIRPDYANAYNDRGLVYCYKGQYDKAISEYTLAIEIKPDYANAYNNRGFAFYLKGQYDKAITDCTRAIEINPKYAEPYYNRANANFYKKEYGKSWDDVHKAEGLGWQVLPEFLKALREASGRDK